MSGLLAAFLSSFVATLLIIRFKHLHQRFSADWDLSGPQKFHTKVVPRIGGISIAIGLCAAILFRLKNVPNPSIELTLLICAIPTFAIGVTEDLTKKISIRLRLIFTTIAATLFVYLVPVQITRLDIPYLDLIFIFPVVGAVLTVFAITGLANAYNIIDGFNGLAGMVGIITLMAITYVGFALADPLIMYLSLIMASSILGFFIWNYPRGLIFLGDGGAYLIGFWIASLSILLTYRHQEISPWFALLINGYPIMETLFTIYRRKIHQGKSPGQPDGIHFHTLMYRRILMNNHQDNNVFSANARTAPYFWALAVMSIAPAVLWWQSTPTLIGACTLFTTSYVWLYGRIVKFKTPKWLHLEK
ncbi:glycosyltransferase family 4 protein [Polynucleobacter sp. 80A-SIGWE]|uniref:glycosyltransferase family 4 protein n=1 Tax=Polynucleobacter sp. 80A-SIGWE TaxID=2689100 RepID=UPI001C0CE86B|nr:glycosyltransferase [Polynucleobacter sp. 80A-SIGWE]MBU3589085.1 glycosyltransferase family 4 protein [Polynucleobacter sp. 80A-SIGWE]